MSNYPNKIKQPFTIWKYILGVFGISLLAGLAESSVPGQQTFWMVFIILYTILGFALWVFQTIKYGNLNRRMQAIQEAELLKKEKDLGLK